MDIVFLYHHRRYIVSVKLIDNDKVCDKQLRFQKKTVYNDRWLVRGTRFRECHAFSFLLAFLIWEKFFFVVSLPHLWQFNYF